jgi:hypothetical protein
MIVHGTRWGVLSAELCIQVFRGVTARFRCGFLLSPRPAVPGLMAAAALIYNSLVWIGAPLAIRNVCVFFAPVMSAATALFTYFLTQEVGISVPFV